MTISNKRKSKYKRAKGESLVERITKIHYQHDIAMLKLQMDFHLEIAKIKHDNIK